MIYVAIQIPICLYSIQEENGEYMLSNIKREINKLLPEDRKAQVAYTGQNMVLSFISRTKERRNTNKIERIMLNVR